jgi:hypothetical protein
MNQIDQSVLEKAADWWVDFLREKEDPSNHAKTEAFRQVLIGELMELPKRPYSVICVALYAGVKDHHALNKTYFSPSQVQKAYREAGFTNDPDSIFPHADMYVIGFEKDKGGQIHIRRRDGNNQKTIIPVGTVVPFDPNKIDFAKAEKVIAREKRLGILANIPHNTEVAYSSEGFIRTHSFGEGAYIYTVVDIESDRTIDCHNPNNLFQICSTEPLKAIPRDYKNCIISYQNPFDSEKPFRSFSSLPGYLFYYQRRPGLFQLQSLPLAKIVVPQDCTIGFARDAQFAPAGSTLLVTEQDISEEQTRIPKAIVLTAKVLSSFEIVPATSLQDSKDPRKFPVGPTLSEDVKHSGTIMYR